MMDLLVIVVDGFDYELFSENPSLSAKVSKIAENEAQIKHIVSVKPIVTPACATSILTMKQPNDHRIMDFYDEHYNVVNARLLRNYRYWIDILQLRGYRLGLWKVPMIYPRNYRGFVVWGLEAPIVSPNPNLRSFLEKNDILPENIIPYHNDKEYYEYFVEQTKKEFNIFMSLCKKYYINVGFFWLRYSDTLSHVFYGRDKQKIIDYYYIVMKCIKDLIEYLQPRVWVIFGDHGFAKKEYIISIPGLLIQNGIIKWSSIKQRIFHYFARRIGSDVGVKVGRISLANRISEMFRFKEVFIVGSEEHVIRIVPGSPFIQEVLDRDLNKYVEVRGDRNSIIIVPRIKGVALTKIVYPEVLVENRSKVRTGIHWIDTLLISNTHYFCDTYSITDIGKIIIELMKSKVLRKKA